MVGYTIADLSVAAGLLAVVCMVFHDMDMLV